MTEFEGFHKDTNDKILGLF